LDRREVGWVRVELKAVKFSNDKDRLRESKNGSKASIAVG